MSSSQKIYRSHHELIAPYAIPVFSIDFRFVININLSIYATLIGILWELGLIKQCHYYDSLT